MKGVVVAVVGRASAGKSTFINTVTENKVSIVSSVPQSTRAVVRGMYEDSRGQIVFADTPGLHIDSRSFNMRLQSSLVNAIRGADAVLYILDCNDSPGDEEKKVAFYAATSGKPVVAFLNKCDVARPESVAASRKFVSENVKGAVVLEGSAMLDSGIDEVLQKLYLYARECDGPLMDHWTDATIEFRVEEAILEQVFNLTTDEIPHSCMVEVSEITALEQKVTVMAVIRCERDSQKGILIGRGGSVIKAIRVSAQKSLRKIFPGRRVELFLSVKTDPKWKKDRKLLEKAGY